MRHRLRDRIALAFLTVTVLATGCSEGPAGPGDQPDPPGSDPTAYDHARGPGASAGDFLAGSDYDRLVVQIQYVGSYAPDTQGLAELETFLGDRLNKPLGIQIETPEQIPVTQQATYSSADIRAIEATHRTMYTQGRTLVAYVLWIDGEFDQSSTVLGIAYNNTSMALFAEVIDDNTGGALQPSRTTVEATVAVHEFGHILGLVNNGSAMQVEHQDEPNGHHCDNDNCLMYYAVRTTDFLSNLMGGMPDLDQNCVDDLQANGGR